MGAQGKRSGVWLAVVLLAVAGIAVWVGVRLLRSDTASWIDAAGEERADSTAGSALPAPARAADLSRAASEPGRSAAPSATELAAASEALPSAKTIAVLAIERDSRRPVAGAHILYKATVEDLEARSTPWFWLGNGELEERITEGAQTFVADAEGRASVPLPERDGVVVATAEGLWGWYPLSRSSESPVKIELIPDRTVCVRVVDARGAPVGAARVALRTRWDVFYGGDGFHDLAHATTRSGDGIAELRHAGYFLSMQRNAQARHLAALAGVLAPPVEVELDPDHLPEEPIELVAPASGEVEVRVLDVDGELYAGPVDVSLRMLTAEEVAHAEREPEERAAQYLQGVRGGSAVFSQVSPELDLVAGVRRSDAAQVNQGRGRSAPAGGRSTITIRFGDKSAVVRGRALGADGAPRGDQRLRARVEVAGVDPDDCEVVWTVRTDDAGLFVLDLRTRSPEEARGTLVVCETGEHGEEVGWARKPMPAVLTHGEHEFGDFVLAPIPVVIAGRVLDSQDRPVSLARISVSARRFEGQSEDFWWEEALTNPTVTDAQGRFAVRGEISDTEVSLQANKENTQGEPLLVNLPSPDVVLRLDEAGAIAGRLLLDPSVPANSLQVSVRTPGAEDLRGQDNGAWRIVQPGADGEFTQRGMRPGTYVVSVTLVSSWRSLATIEDVTVDAGATTRDPRLNPLDLRGKLALVRLHIVDEAGEPIARGTIRSSPTGGERDRETSWTNFARGDALLARGERGVDVTISVEGFCMRVLEGVTSDQEVALERAPRIRLVLAEGLRPPDPPLELVGMLRPAGPNLHNQYGTGEQPAFDAAGRLELDAPARGPVKVELYVRRQDENGSSAFGFDDETERILEVRGGPGLETFEIRFDQAKMEQAAKSLRESDR